VFAAVAVDAFFPAVPSETVVVGAAVVAVTGEPHVAGLVAAATAGAFAGDSVSYALGRFTIGARRLQRRPRIRRAHARAGRLLARRGGTALVAARFIPGGRTATTLVAGSVRYPIRRYWVFTAVAAAAWAGYATALGYLGGELFEQRPLAGLAVGLALASGLTLTIEAIRYALRHRTRPEQPFLDRTAPPTRGDADAALVAGPAGDHSRTGVDINRA
jgi:membrane protein DedA with SNARE-associated domain